MAEQTDPRRERGWKRDPWRRFAGRYWDGSQWTEHVVNADKVAGVDPVPSTPPPAPVPPPPDQVPTAGPSAGLSDEQRQGAYLILGGAGAVAVGCFLPWISITAPFIGTVSKAGIEGDGVFFLAIAALIALFAFDLVRKVPPNIGRRRWGLGVLIAAAALLTALEVADITSRFADISGEELPVATSYGPGLWLVGIGVLVALVGWGRTPWTRMRL